MNRLCVMVNIKLLFILAAVIATGRGQLTDLLFPGLGNAARSLSEATVNQPIVQLATSTSGELFSSILNGLTAIPLSVGRALSTMTIPNIFTDKNLVDMADNVVTDYSSGLHNEDARLAVADLVAKYGYPMDKHQVITEDGYILSVYRIPGNGSVVFLMHGLLGSADDYVIAGPESGLAYNLAGEGYDVWMGNARGNKYSRRHRELHPSDAAFWDFTWHEIGCRDLPAMIDYVLSVTDQDSLKYIGHSQGTTSFFVMASEKPEYNSKISLMIALSPVAFMSHDNSPVVRLLAPTNSFIHSLLQLVGVHEFLPDSFIMRTLKKLICGTSATAEILCSNVLFLTCGFGFEQLNVTNLPVIYGHVPSGASTKQFVHYAQGTLSGEFRKFDLGPSQNLRVYGSSVPPEYDLSKVVAPVSLFYSDADWLAHPIDVDKLYNKLGNAIDIHKVPFKPFNHLDFVWAKDFNTLIYKRIEKLLLYF